MKTQILLSVAIIGLMSGPTWAGCAEELAKLDSAVITAETGASTDPSGMEPTKHQQEVLSGDKSDKPETDTETTASTSGRSRSDNFPSEGGDRSERRKRSRSDDEGRKRYGQGRR